MVGQSFFRRNWGELLKLKRQQSRKGAQGKEGKEMGFKKDRKIEKYEKDRGRRGEEIRKELERWERVRGDGTLIEGGGHWQRGGGTMTTEGREKLTKKEGAHTEGEEHLQRGGGRTLREGGRLYLNMWTQEPEDYWVHRRST